MSFINVFEELNKLYESPEQEVEEEVLEEEAEDIAVEDEVAEEPVEEAPNEEEPAADEQEAEELEQLILECANCGAIIIRDAAEVVVDEESDLANVDYVCQYCEEAAGHKIIGAVAPYEAEEEDEAEPAESEAAEEAEEAEAELAD